MQLFKLQEMRDAPYYTRFQVRGRRYKWSTKTNDKALALRRAKQYYDNVVSENFGVVSAMKARSTVWSFEDLFTAYDKLPTPDATTRRRNIAAMKQVLAASNRTQSDRIDILSGQIGLAWQQACQKEGSGVSNVSSNTVLRMAKSLFSGRALASYDCELPRKQIDLFLSTLPLPEAKRRPDIPADQAIAQAKANLPQHPQIYRAFLLAAYCGLRSAEIIAARKDWLERQADGAYLLYVGGKPDQFVTKSGDWRVVGVEQGVALTLLAGDGELIVGQYAADVVQRKLVAMLQAYGFPAKAVQSCRRWYGSRIAATQGIWAAKDALGHSSVAVTETYYARALRPAMPLALSAQG